MRCETRDLGLLPPSSQVNASCSRGLKDLEHDAQRGFDLVIVIYDTDLKIPLCLVWKFSLEVSEETW